MKYKIAVILAIVGLGFYFLGGNTLLVNEGLSGPRARATQTAQATTGIRSTIGPTLQTHAGEFAGIKAGTMDCFVHPFTRTQDGDVIAKETIQLKPGTQSEVFPVSNGYVSTYTSFGWCTIFVGPTKAEVEKAMEELKQ